MAILESMSLGIPVVATEVIGNRDLVKSDKTGFTYKIGDLKAAVNHIKYILNPEYYSKFSSSAKNIHTLYFSANAMCGKTYSLYQDIVKKY
jgi:glycosyltransferase involved in cell wall biosynthesis